MTDVVDQGPRESTGRAATTGTLVGVFLALGVMAVGQATEMPVYAALPAAALCAAFLGGPGRTLERNFARSVAAPMVATAGALVFAREARSFISLSPLAWTAIAAAGGLLGLTFAVTWRRVLVDGHGGPFPEARASAALLSHPIERSAAPFWIGAATGGIARLLAPWKGAMAAGSPGLLAVGFFLGPRTTLVLLGGGLAGAALAMNSSWRDALGVVGAGFAIGAGLATVARLIPRWRRLRAEESPYRVRFEIGGHGTRIEDMTPRVDRDAGGGLLALTGIVACAVLVIAPLGFGAATVAAVVALSAVLVAVVARLSGDLGVTILPTAVAGGLSLFLVCRASGVSERVAFAAALTLAVAGAVGGELTQSFAIGRTIGGEPRRAVHGALIGVLCVSAVVWAVSTRDWPMFHAFFTCRIPALFPVEPTPLPWAPFFVALAAGGAVGFSRLPALLLAVGALLPLTAIVPLLAGGLVRGGVDRVSDEARREAGFGRGVRFGAGLLLGAGLIPHLGSLVRSSEWFGSFSLGPFLPGWTSPVILVLISLVLLRIVHGSRP